MNTIPPLSNQPATTASLFSRQVELAENDVAALKPRMVSNAHLNLQFYVPETWQESMNDKSLLIVDPLTGTTIEAIGMRRSDVSVEQWAEIRLPMVEKEMPYLEDVRFPCEVTVKDWGDRIECIAIEYVGTAPGDNEQTACLVCCLRNDTRLISFTIKARVAVFEKNRAMYKWMVSRIDIGAMAQSATKPSFGAKALNVVANFANKPFDIRIVGPLVVILIVGASLMDRAYNPPENGPVGWKGELATIEPIKNYTEMTTTQRGDWKTGRIKMIYYRADITFRTKTGVLVTVPNRVLPAGAVRASQSGAVKIEYLPARPIITRFPANVSYE